MNLFAFATRIAAGAPADRRAATAVVYAPMNRRRFLGMAAASVPLVAGTGLALSPGRAMAAEDPIYTSLFSSKALGGYDTVAYFTEGEPVEGSSEFETDWQGATWRFASADNLASFEADPERYAPAYGGYCAYAASQGYTASGDPLQWTIVDDRLYVNYDAEVKALWLEDTAQYIRQADENWPGVLDS